MNGNAHKSIQFQLVFNLGFLVLSRNCISVSIRTDWSLCLINNLWKCVAYGFWRKNFGAPVVYLEHEVPYTNIYPCPQNGTRLTSSERAREWVKERGRKSVVINFRKLCQIAIIIDHSKSHFNIWESMIGARVQITYAIWHLFIERMHLIWYKPVEVYEMKIMCSLNLIQPTTPFVWQIG